MEDVVKEFIEVVIIVFCMYELVRFVKEIWLSKESQKDEK
jgi:hypothetical protein